MTEQAAVDPAAAAFVLSLYGVESGGTGEAVPENDWDLEAVSSARTAALFAEAKALTPAGYIGYPEGHPLVEFEEWGSLKLEDVVTTQHGSDRADVSLILAFTQPNVRLNRTFNLVKEDGRWRLDDLKYDQSVQTAQSGAQSGPNAPIPGLLDGFHSFIAEAKAHPFEDQ
ncbi:MAG TPA: hypothetical protein VF633_12120 [Brevundimonas sp.]